MFTPLDVVESWCKVKVAKYSSKFICTVNKMEQLNDERLADLERIREL